MNRLAIAFGLFGAAQAWSGPIAAQTYTVNSITTSNLGNVAAAASGQTIFRVDPATGAVTIVSGAGSRISAGSVRSLVTVRCGNQAACNTANALLTVATTGMPTNRAAALQRFAVSVSGASATLVTTPTPGAPITFTIGPVGRNATKTFWLGFDFPINGDNSGGSTGISQSQFAVTVSRIDGSRSNTRAGNAQATVFRRLSIAKSADLAFGRIVRPSTGTGTVSLSQSTGAVTVTGVGTAALASPTPVAAAFSIAGEGGQSISISVPSTFDMNGPSGVLTVTTAPNISGAQTLSGGLGSAGSLALRVGGSFNLLSGTPTGSYSGTFTVTVQYN